MAEGGLSKEEAKKLIRKYKRSGRPDLAEYVETKAGRRRGRSEGDDVVVVEDDGNKRKRGPRVRYQN